jgi:hypothetical protein
MILTFPKFRPEKQNRSIDVALRRALRVVLRDRDRNFRGERCSRDRIRNAHLSATGTISDHTLTVRLFERHGQQRPRVHQCSAITHRERLPSPVELIY